MAAAALTSWLPLSRRPALEAHAASSLAFDHFRGPVVAVCGLVGGAGTSTAAFALAQAAARESVRPVLLTELDDHSGGLAALTGRSSALSLRSLARRLDSGDRPREPVVELEDGLRLIARTPNTSAGEEQGDVARVLDEARAAHGLVVIDCGQWPGIDPQGLAVADHVIWVTSATTAAAARVSLLMNADVIPDHARRPLVAVATSPTDRASVRSLRKLAAGRFERLVLVPHEKDPGQRDAIRRAGESLAGLGSLLRQRRV